MLLLCSVLSWGPSHGSLVTLVPVPRVTKDPCEPIVRRGRQVPEVESLGTGTRDPTGAGDPQRPRPSPPCARVVLGKGDRCGDKVRGVAGREGHANFQRCDLPHIVTRSKCEKNHILESFFGGRWAPWGLWGQAPETPPDERQRRSNRSKMRIAEMPTLPSLLQLMVCRR